MYARQKRSTWSNKKRLDLIRSMEKASLRELKIVLIHGKLREVHQTKRGEEGLPDENSEAKAQWQGETTV